ncbi:hypothetical protein HanXRQr2_Chr17g0813351 [Helianthus annuus]|uniref:Uncharacterized protein n=1 Tax=Helianthus annuus TaxID=4232 RepID=A0A9K3GVB4_HELAN|nr:hypothetical protein HanXRQr2_Chr17g0813351 [Helianthus annuus]
MREMGKVGIIYQGVTSWAWGFGPKGFGSKAHSRPSGPLATGWLRVMVSSRSLDSHSYIYVLHTYNTLCK